MGYPLPAHDVTIGLRRQGTRWGTYDRDCGPTHDGDYGGDCQDHRSGALAIFNSSRPCALCIQEGLSQEYTRWKISGDGRPLSVVSCSHTSGIPAEWPKLEHLPRTWHSSRLIKEQCDSSLRQSRALHPLDASKPSSRLSDSILGVPTRLLGAYCLPGWIY